MSESEGYSYATSVFDSVDVEICATILSDTPPTLPLRAELPSLGFEIIYNGSGIGERTSRYEAKRAVERFRKEEQVRELQKRRFFPKSSKRIKEKLAERKRIEKELRMPHAFSYESYEHLLYDDALSSTDESSETHSSTSSRSSATGRNKRRRKMLRKKRGVWGFFRKTRSADDSLAMSEVKIKKHRKGKSLDNVFEAAGFDDVLAPNDQHREEKTAVTSVFSGSADNSMASQSRDALHNMEIEFVTSPANKKYLPGLNTVEEAEANDDSETDGERDGGLDENIKNAFANLDPVLAIDQAWPRPGVPKAGGSDSVSDVFAGIESSSQLYGSTITLTHHRNSSQPEEIETALAMKDEDIKSNPSLSSVASRRSVGSGRAESAPVNSFDEKGEAPEEDEPPVVEKKSSWFETAIHAIDSMFKHEEKSAAEDRGEKSPKAQEEKSPKAKPIVQAKKPATVQPVSEKDDLSELARSFGTSDGSVSTLFEALGSTMATQNDVESVVRLCPELLQVKRHEDGQTALHVLCGRGMPNRSKVALTLLTDFLLRDIASYKKSISLVYSHYPAASKLVDKNGDLPVHLLARTLMEWEAEWYEKVYGQATKEKDPKGRTANAISHLYQNMSESIEIVLRPIHEEASLCRHPGSVGKILPLHIACMFTPTVGTLRLLLMAYPDAAGIPCDVGKLRTFVPHNSKPLELHEGLSTDFPKWESETKHHDFPDLTWSQYKSGDRLADDCVRRSDLLFAFHPSIEPYRCDKTRIRRLENMVLFEARKVAEKKQTTLSRVAELIWIWMCTFQESRKETPTYAKSVQRIIDEVPTEALKYLSSVKLDDGRLVVTAANAQCCRIIHEKLDKDTPLVASPHPIKMWSDHQLSLISPKGHKELAVLCRTIFNIKETSFPTSFVVLPYTLTQNAEGKLGLASISDAEVAIKFTKGLVHLTDPRSVLYFLDIKSTKHYEQSLFEGSGDYALRVERSKMIREHETTLLSLYHAQEAYLYLIDESTGLPVVRGAPGYPIVLRQPANMIQKLFPLMVLGMIMMRGEKALSILVNILLDEGISVTSPNWILAAQDLQAYLLTEEARKMKSSDQLDELKMALMNFVSSGVSKQRKMHSPKTGTTEWNVELSILKMLIDMNDKKRTLGGLKAEQVGGKGVAWCRKIETPSSPVAAKVEEVRRKCDALKRVDFGGHVPCVDELSRKHDELKKHFNFGSVSSDASTLFTSSSPKSKLGRSTNSQSDDPLGFPQPENESDDNARGRRDSDSDDSGAFWTEESFKLLRSAAVEAASNSTRVKVPSSNKNETESLQISEKYSEADDQIVIHIAGDDDEIMRSRTLLERLRGSMSQSSGCDNVSTTTSVASSVIHRKHALLFEALSFTPSADIPSYRFVIEQPRFMESRSARLWQDLVNELDHSLLCIDDAHVIRVKYQLTQEAKRLSLIDERLRRIQKTHDELVERRRRRKGILVDVDEAETTSTRSVSKARMLLLRLCSLEDRIVYNEIEIQHIKLRAFTLDKQVEDRPTTSPRLRLGLPPRPLVKAPYDSMEKTLPPTFDSWSDEDSSGSPEEIDLLDPDTISDSDNSIISWRYNSETGLVEI